MEVHAHTHTERKKWTHYLWEFLMLFLAVFCGFLAENLREHTVEKNRERQYIISLIEDWKEDTAMMNNAVNNESPAAIARADSLIQFLNSKDPGGNATEIYNLTPQILRRFFHSFQDRTIVQLRNAGGLRLITNNDVKDSISLYYERAAIIQAFDEAISSNSKKIFDLITKLFYEEDYSKLFDPQYDNFKGSHDQLRLKSSDRDLINEFSFLIYAYRGWETQFLKRTKSLDHRLPEMISFIKKEYHLK